MKAVQLSALIVCLTSGADLRAQVLDIPSMRGDSPADVALVLGAPAHSSPATSQGQFSLRDDIFEFTLGGQGSTASGSLAVSYCDDQAFAFKLTLSGGQATSEALLGLVGFDTATLTLRRGTSSFARWSGADTEYLVATSVNAGWNEVEAEYDSFGC